MKSAARCLAFEALHRGRRLCQQMWHTSWSRLVLIGLGCFAAVVTLILLTPWRLGVDVQRLLGYPSCLPSLVYVIDYRVTHPPRLGDYAVFQFPATGLAVGPKPGQRTIKMVMGLPGDHIKVEGTELYVRGMHWDRLWLAKSIPGKNVGDFDAEYVISNGYFFAYGTEKESLDSRYFGPVEQRLIVGYARPLF